MVKPRAKITARTTRGRAARGAQGAPGAKAPPARLAEYASKRDFEATPEPAPRAVARQPVRRGVFVVQKHDARRLHYDVRLEIDGAMMSFAVPKGPTYDPSVKRLAVEVEDHPIAYNAFEGTIPAGNYGAGEVAIWDRGVYETVPPGQAALMRKKGHIKARFFGEKLRGEWHFVRTREVSEKSQWIFFKADDALADASRDVVTEAPESVVAGRAANARELATKIGEVARATSGPVLGDASKWWFEIKYDGYRILACKSGPEVRLVSRAGHDWTMRFREIADAVAELPVGEVILDGEACVVDAEGVPSFGRLQEWLGEGSRGRSSQRAKNGAKASAAKGEAEVARKTKPAEAEGTLVYALFDAPWCNGIDQRRKPIEERRALVQGLLREARPPLTLSAAIEGRPDELMDLARARDLEGLIAKRKGSPYTAGPTRDWVKLKCVQRQEFAVIGYVPLTSATKVVGALLLAIAGDDGALHFAGKVGTGLDDAQRRSLAKQLDALVVDAPPVADAEHFKGERWARPELVAEVGFIEWTESNKPRHPTFIGLREDKTPMQCVREASARVPGAKAMAGGSGSAKPKRKATATATRNAPAKPAPAAASVKATLTNPQKVLYPRDAVTKLDVFTYYGAIAEVMLPHLEGRPLVVQRWPNGIDKAQWFQHNMPDKTPPFVRMMPYEERRLLVADDVEALRWLANLAALTLHQWSCHAPRDATTRAEVEAALAHPDYVVIDLDPGSGAFRDLIEVALAVRTLLDALELESVVKTTGKRGLHVMIGLAPGQAHEDAVTFAEQLSRAVEKVLPGLATTERMIAKRGGRLYLDYGQNGEGRTVVAPYSLRALDGARVSAPLSWDEVTESLDLSRFTMRTILARVEKRGDLLAPALAGKADLRRLVRGR